MPRRFSIDTTYFNAMIYGDPGVGKTQAAASATEVEELCPVLLIDVEGGTLVLQNTYPNIDIEPVRNWGEMAKLWKRLYDNDCKLPISTLDLKSEQWVEGEMIHYRTLIVDNTSELQRLNMRRIMAEVVKEHPERDEDIPSQREYGKNLEQMRAFFRQFRDLPANVIFTAHAMKDKDERTGVITIAPGFTGKMSSEVGGYIDEVLYLSVRPTKGGEGDNKRSPNTRVLLTDKTGNIIAKDRSGNLDRVIENPTMAIINAQLRKQTKGNKA